MYATHQLDCLRRPARRRLRDPADWRDGARFAAHDPRGYAPNVGDLVCVSRSNAVAGFAELRCGPYHCDPVVGVDAGEIDAIGGNVGDAVSLARYEVDERGLLKQRDDQPWSS